MKPVRQRNASAELGDPGGENKKSEQKAKHRYPAPEPAPTSSYRQSHAGTARPKPPRRPASIQNGSASASASSSPPTPPPPHTVPILSLPHANRGLAKGGRGEDRQAPTRPQAEPRAANGQLRPGKPYRSVSRSRAAHAHSPSPHTRTTQARPSLLLLPS